MTGYAIAGIPVYHALFQGIEVKANHPITSLNPTEWFTPIYVGFDTGLRAPEQEHQRIFVRGHDTMWFNLAQCEVRHAVSLQG